jgi:hypothetical protein
MTQQIVHQQRLAWDGARAFAAAIDSDELYFWLSDRVGDLLGPAHRAALSESRSRLHWSTRTDAVHVEAGLWRARLQDLLGERPESTGALKALVEDCRTRLAEPAGVSAAGWPQP